MVHINNGNASFCKAGEMMDLYHTEWSWSPLFADVDNDGYRDLLITNGFDGTIRNINLTGTFHHVDKHP